MFRNIIFLACFFCFNFLSANEHSVLIFRAQTSEEAFSYVEDLYSQLPWFKENGYQVSLPLHPKFEYLLQNSKTLSETDKDDLKEVFFTEIYNISLYNHSLQDLKESESLITRGLEKLATLKENWGFNLMGKYEIVLTLYGPGGDYNSKKGIVRLFTTPHGKFKRSTGYEVLLHEIVHIGIEEAIVKKYKLSHWEKERLVDLICSQYLNDVLPAYKMQQKGDKRIDAFADQYAIIYELPLSIAKFIEQHPR